MQLREFERRKTQKIVERIQKGEFDENDVDNLLMKLRAYGKAQQVFREFADFVAHNDSRDRGLANELLDGMRLSMNYFVAYVSPGRKLDISQPFPSWIKRLMRYQALKADPEALHSKFGFTSEELVSRIETLFRGSNGSEMVRMERRKPPKRFLKALTFVMSCIAVRPITQSILLEQLLEVLEKSQFKFDRKELLEQGDKITLVAMLLMHNVTFKVRDGTQGTCQITCDEPAIPIGLTSIDAEGNPFQIVETFGSLSVRGVVPFDHGTGPIDVAFPVVISSLPAEIWCDESLFKIEEYAEGATFLGKKLDFDRELHLTADFKLGGGGLSC